MSVGLLRPAGILLSLEACRPEALICSSERRRAWSSSAGRRCRHPPAPGSAAALLGIDVPPSRLLLGALACRFDQVHCEHLGGIGAFDLVSRSEPVEHRREPVDR